MIPMWLWGPKQTSGSPFNLFEYCSIGSTRACLLIDCLCVGLPMVANPAFFCAREAFFFAAQLDKR